MAENMMVGKVFKPFYYQSFQSIFSIRLIFVSFTLFLFVCFLFFYMQLIENISECKELFFFEKRSCNVRVCEVVRSVCLHVFLCKNFGFIS